MGWGFLGALAGIREGVACHLLRGGAAQSAFGAPANPGGVAYCSGQAEASHRHIISHGGQRNQSLWQPQEPRIHKLREQLQQETGHSKQETANRKQLLQQSWYKPVHLRL